MGGGLLSTLSPLYPRGPIDLGHRLKALQGELPDMPGWTWFTHPAILQATSLFGANRTATLIVGDVFITTNQESAYSVALQRPELHVPPQYYTPDWQQARLSVQRLGGATARVGDHWPRPAHARVRHARRAGFVGPRL